MAWSGEWVRLAACRALDEPDRLFVRGAAQHDAKRVCLGCPVRLECLAEALDARIEWGVWGGMTERERRAVLRRRPRVQSWRRLLEAAREEYGQDDDLDGDLADAGALTSVQRVAELASASAQPVAASARAEKAQLAS